LHTGYTRLLLRHYCHESLDWGRLWVDIVVKSAILYVRRMGNETKTRGREDEKKNGSHTLLGLEV